MSGKHMLHPQRAHCLQHLGRGPGGCVALSDQKKLAPGAGRRESATNQLQCQGKLNLTGGVGYVLYGVGEFTDDLQSEPENWLILLYTRST